ncbi:unnamed protein product [Orchesella dallaii]|uniref:Nuclear protein localization protein 4 n=1 Tax=Orchesella dallaii TaxID=48710 RepID=A0ABP1Q875_9HEXA
MVETQITIRLQSREGLKRIQTPPSLTTKALYDKVKESFGYCSYGYTLHRDRRNLKGSEIRSSISETIKQQGIKHGDLVFVEPIKGVNLFPEDEEMQDATAGSSSSGSTPGSINDGKRKDSYLPDLPLPASRSASMGSIVEDNVDITLSNQDGLIKRQKDSKMCRHGEKGQCVFCAPLEPYDEGYLKEQNIKHLSFHSYLRKLTGGVDKGKFAALEDLSVSIAEGCTAHPPWPKGICSKCQPSAVTLNRQTYRHVDNVMFENPLIVERFLSYWRSSGCQRMGFLFGRFEEHTDVPLGIRARVAAIYEPPQDTAKDGINFSLNDEKIEMVNQIATGLGLKCVGWIFTDLIPEDISKGTVKHLRGIHSYFMSAQECITAAYFQNTFPNPCKLSPKRGYFGSKFATVIVTGDEKHQVHMVGYQVSNQCMGLVKDLCLLPTKDAPELGYVKESSEKQYVPDVFYKQKDEYGNEVTRLARPLPVEYLLVDVPVSTPKEPQFTFTVKSGITPFPVENRLVDGQIQDFNALASYLNQFDSTTPFIEIVSDFHFLVFIATMDFVSIRDYVGPLLEAIRNGDYSKANEWRQSEVWGTVERLVEASIAPGMASNASVPGSSGQQQVITPQSVWTCSHCTFHNQNNGTACEMCQLPRA